MVSDVDGTITRSDLLGHVLPTLGVDWSHPGITQLFHNIARNGYQIMFLSSRCARAWGVGSQRDSKAAGGGGSCAHGTHTKGSQQAWQAKSGFRQAGSQPASSCVMKRCGTLRCAPFATVLCHAVLSRRAIAQANITREYLHTLVQNDYKMPSGPVIISPHGLLPSLYR